MNRSAPFSRAIALVAAISAALDAGMNWQFVQHTHGNYQSRGHGRGVLSGKSMRNRYSQGGRVYPQNGEREMARRRRQIASGIIQVTG